MEDSEVLETGDILIRNNRIQAVGPTGSLQVPEGAKVMDLSGKTIVPGFVDTHAHMWPSWGIQTRSVTPVLRQRKRRVFQHSTAGWRGEKTLE